MVQHCEVCRVSFNDGEDCDCCAAGVANGYVSRGNHRLHRVAYARKANPFDALKQFMTAGHWDGRSEVAVVDLLPEATGYRVDIFGADNIRRYLGQFACVTPECPDISGFIRQLFDDPNDALPLLEPDGFFHTSGELMVIV